MEPSLIEAARQALRHFRHMDEANAAMHCAEVRYSPITFRLAEGLRDYNVNDPVSNDVAEVLIHSGKYEEDPGR